MSTSDRSIGAWPATVQSASPPPPPPPPPPPTRLEADRVDPGSDPVAPELGRFAEDIAIVGRERLGAVEEELDADVVEDGHPAGRQPDERGQMLPVLRQPGEG